MSKSTALIIAIVAISLATVFVSSSYGEEVSVEIDTNKYDLDSQICNEGTSTGEWWCNWKKNTSGYTGGSDENPPEEDGCLEGYDRDGITGECTLFSQLEGEAIQICKDDPTCPLQNDIPGTTKWDKAMDQIKPDSDDISDKQLIMRINEMLGAQCYQGYGQSTGIQSIRSFDIPTEEYVDEDGITKLRLSQKEIRYNIDLEGLLAEIELHRQECIAQEKLDAGRDIQHRSDKAIQDSLLVTLNHADVAKDVPVWSQQRASEEANRDIDHQTWSILEDICKGSYAHSFKMTFSECRVFFEENVDQGDPSKKPKMTDYGADIEARVNQFDADGGKSMFVELQKEKLAEDIARINQMIRALNDQ